MTATKGSGLETRRAKLPKPSAMQRHMPQRRGALFKADDGNAVVEFVGLSVILLIPLVYLILTLAQLQSASFAADTAARQISRLVATEVDPLARDRKTAAVIALVADDYGVELTEESVSVTCAADRCPSPGAYVQVEISINVALPGLGVLGGEVHIAEVTGKHALIAEDGVGGV